MTTWGGMRGMEVKVAQSCPDSLQPHGIYSLWNSLGKNTGVGSLPLPQGIFTTQGRLPALQADSLPAEPQGKPRNTGVGSLSLLQHIFLIQDLNWYLLHCRWILYQLRCQGFPEVGEEVGGWKGGSRQGYMYTCN